MATKLQDGNTPCLAATPSDPRPTVLVFDSGVGGVYNEIRQLLPDRTLYLMLSITLPSPMARRAKSLSLSVLLKS
jgi:Glutamate racemase